MLLRRCLLCVLFKLCLPSLNQGAPSTRNYKTYVHYFLSFQGQVKIKIIRQMSTIYCLLKVVPICLYSIFIYLSRYIFLHKAKSIVLSHLSKWNPPSFNRVENIRSALFYTCQDYRFICTMCDNLHIGSKSDIHQHFSHFTLKNFSYVCSTGFGFIWIII